MVEFQGTKTLEEDIFKIRILKGEWRLALKPRMVLYWSFLEATETEYWGQREASLKSHRQENAEMEAVDK